MLFETVKTIITIVMCAIMWIAVSVPQSERTHK